MNCENDVVKGLKHILEKYDSWEFNNEQSSPFVVQIDYRRVESQESFNFLSNHAEGRKRPLCFYFVFSNFLLNVTVPCPPISIVKVLSSPSASKVMWPGFSVLSISAL